MKLLISLSEKSEDYIHGMELGRLMEKMERGDECVLNNGFPIRNENVAAAKKISIANGYTPIVGDEDYSGWTEFMAIRNTATKN